jgi:radical SAM superfamily enzyme YgiQ (UPF0313 family)
MDRYRATLNGERATNIMGSRSCPYRCVFCHDGASGGNYRRRSADHVAREMRTLVEQFGIRAFFLYDCTATLNPGWIDELSQRILQLRLDIIWSCLSRVSDLEIDTLTRMRRAGCVRVAVGVESGSDRSLKKIRKKTTVASSARFVASLKKVGITPHVYLMLGFPWETRDDFEATLEFVRRAKPDVVEVSFVTPFKGTDLYSMVAGDFQLNMFHDSRVMVEPAFVGRGFSREDLFSYRAKILAAAES